MPKTVRNASSTSAVRTNTSSCLFDGTTDFTGNSIIYVFDWQGKQKGRIAADRNLRKIAIEKVGDYLLALSPDEEGGRNVIKYNLKGKL